MSHPAKTLIDLTPKEMAALIYPKIFSCPPKNEGYEAVLRRDSFERVWRQVKRQGRFRKVITKEVIRGVVFCAELMSRVPEVIGESGFNESGEISGFVQICTFDKIDYEKIFGRVIRVVYDPEGHRYHEAGDYAKIVQGCDAAFLNDDGTITACWMPAT